MTKKYKKYLWTSTSGQVIDSVALGVGAALGEVVARIPTRSSSALLQDGDVDSDVEDDGDSDDDCDSVDDNNGEVVARTLLGTPGDNDDKEENVKF